MGSPNYLIGHSSLDKTGKDIGGQKASTEQKLKEPIIVPERSL
jgi:hypothetical protein